ncbi:granulocyte colony-stimulating factor receptor [Conger conger]|uniref:granulocyte colony-stimulating factor receptor n=1 Tax=Conger conger TaxID=82655 RepID=UPI002A599B6D|nr:granulocyte colony-stimulating factor receptor [Conger conger]
MELFKFVTVTLFTFLIPPDISVRGSPCAEIRVQAPVAVLGSPFSASCFVPEGCPLVEGRSFRIEWRLNERVVAANQSGRVSTVTVGSFSDVEAALVCCVCWEEAGCLTADGVTIRGGHPPSAPQNLTCLTNLTGPLTFTCTWDPGRETHLPTNYTLHTEISLSEPERRAYPQPLGRHACTIPRGGFTLYKEMTISVMAQNALGRVSSEPLSLDPMDSVKFDPPVLLGVKTEPLAFGCLSLQWSLSKQQQWVTENLLVQVRFQMADSDTWTGEMKDSPGGDGREALQLCGLLHGTDYRVRMRVRRVPGPWSEWGNSGTGATLERAPTGKLSVWLKVVAESQTHTYVQIFWKPGSWFRANGKNVSLEVSLPIGQRGQGRATVCRTQQRHCEAALPQGMRSVTVRAINSAGGSSASRVQVYQHRGMESVSDITVSSVGDTSLRVSWTPAPVAVGYVLEWGPELQGDLRFLSFQLLGPNQTTALISDGIEPHTPYWISVYARYRNGIGVPVMAEGYSQQKAPSMAPSVRVGEIHHTWARLAWEPIPLRERNGIIQNYTVYYWDDPGRTRAVTIRPTETGVTLSNLRPESNYKAFISASTEGGAVNGTVVTLKTAVADAWGDVITVVPACVGLMLFFILIMLACLSKQDRIKMRFWPMIPDPANSSIKDWTEGDTLPEYPAFPSMKDMQEPVPVKLSWFSLLDVPEGPPEKGAEGPTMDDLWLQDPDPRGPAEPPRDPARDSEAVREAVPYATVVFANPYLSQERPPPASTYLRSDSTQPLLGEESPSPRAYQNFHFPEEEGGARESTGSQGGSGAFWEEFPLLSVLNVQGPQREA